MTQPPHGGTASQRMQSTNADSAPGSDTGSGRSGSTKTDSAPERTAGNGSKPAGGSSGPGDFGQTTISGSGTGRQGSSGGNYGMSGSAFAPPSGSQTQHGPQQAGQSPRQQGPSSGPQSGQQGSSRSATGGRGARNRGPRRARLQLRHISPLTVLKFSCVLAIALFFVWLIVVGVLYGVLDAAGVIQNVNDTVVQLNGSGSKPPITAGIVFGGAAIIGVVNIVLFVALTTIGSVIYNLCADLVGGIEITLSER